MKGGILSAGISPGAAAYNRFTESGGGDALANCC
jgi:hypothetical protein